MHMMAKFVIKHLRNCQLTEQGYPQCPPGPSAEDLVHIQFDPRGLPLPLLVVKTSYARAEYTPPPGSYFSETMSPWLAGKVAQNHTPQPTNILIRNRGKQSSDYFDDVDWWRIAAIRLVNRNLRQIISFKSLSTMAALFPPHSSTLSWAGHSRVHW